MVNRLKHGTIAVGAPGSEARRNAEIEDAKREAQERDALDWEVCYRCGGDGVDGHDCGEDTCCCRFPTENLPCQTCNGDGGWRTPEERQ